MWHSHRYRYSRIVGTLLLMSSVAACTIPPVPTAPIGERVLVPTSAPAEQAASTAADPAAATPTTTSPESTSPTAEPAPPVVGKPLPLKASDVVEAPAALTAAQTELLAGLTSRGAAPELQNEVWFNSEPLKLADLRGKVVMVEFWTFG